ncbi:MAG: hypothetical protein CSA50_03895 [Gammaproteobacteria bacterium]|nr:MAG: hypothetical protein CSA50_03895 [Gammaproteobacteria bacterium]
MTSIFEFKSGESVIHRLDPRCKLAILCLWGASLAAAQWAAAILLLIPLLLLLNRLGATLLSLLTELKIFLVFLFAIFLVRALVTPGTPLISFFGSDITFEGVNEGGIVALRFFNIMILGIVFSSTTSPSQLKAAFQWFLGPIPFVPEKRAAMIMGLSLRFLPLIFSQSREIGQAIIARCGDNRKNPIKRITTHAMALLSKTFGQADTLGLAMEARCYTEHRTDPCFSPSGNERLAFLLAIAYTLMTFFL